MAEEGVFTPEEVGFSRIVNTPNEAVEMVMKSLPVEVKKELTPITRKSKTKAKGKNR
jgi:hypothetical protein